MDCLSMGNSHPYIFYINGPRYILLGAVLEPFGHNSRYLTMNRSHERGIIYVVVCFTLRIGEESS